MADAIRNGLRLEAIAADIAGDGDSARAHHRPPGQEIDGLRLDLAPRGPPRRPLRRAQPQAVCRARSPRLRRRGVVSSEELLERAWDQNADPFTDAVRITVSAPRKRLGEPWIIATVAGVGYRIDSQHDSEPEGGDRG